MSIIKGNHKKKGMQARSLGDKVTLFNHNAHCTAHCRAVENGQTFHMFSEEEITKLLTKNIPRTARIQLER